MGKIKKAIDLDDLLSDDYEEDEEQYGYIEDNIYADHGEDDDLGFPDLDDIPDVMKEITGNSEPLIEDIPELPKDIGAAAADVKPKTQETLAKDASAAKTTSDAPVEPMPEHEFSKEPPKGDNSVTLEVPLPVMEIIDILREHTYTAYLVGECVNLLYLGERVMDFDIACNASLDRIIAIFDERFKTREDLLSRGELIIINGAMGISVAPYRSRIDGSGKPIYCKTIDEDLHRRTFTSETVAYNPYAGIYDPFKGLSCITAEKTTLKAIDEEIYEKLEFDRAKLKRKAQENTPKIVIPALRDNPETILIAMLKCARGEAEMSRYTLRNINANAELTDMMLPSEIARYFRRIILGRNIAQTLMDFKEVVFSIFPVLRVQDGFDQKSEYQEYTLYEHTTKAVGYAFPDYAVRLALLLHAIGKYDCAADRGSHMTFYGHSERGVMLVRDVFEKDYEVDDAVAERVMFMIMHHDDHVSPENVVQYTEFCGMEFTRLLLLLQSANIRAKSSDPVNDRVSSTLRQLADNVTTLGSTPRPQTRRTATIDGLKKFTDLLGRNGV